jgi:peptide/nickel transport system permease protein
VLKRVLMIIPVLLVVTFGVFWLQTFLPGDEAATLAGESATPERIEEVRQQLRLDEPLFSRYGAWLGDAVQGDLGTSLFTRRAVGEEILSRWFVSLTLVGGAVLVSLVVSVPVALFVGRRPGSILDRIVSVICALAVAIPDFVLGMVLIVVLALNAQVFPLRGWVPPSESLGESLRHLVLPVLALSAAMAAVITRQLRSNIADVMGEDFMRTARAKGLGSRAIMVRHALRAAAPTTVSILGVQVARLLGGVVVIETVFGIHGLGELTVTAIQQRDLPMIAGIVPVLVVIAIGANLLADVVNTRIDPRLRRR